MLGFCPDLGRAPRAPWTSPPARPNVGGTTPSSPERPTHMTNPGPRPAAPTHRRNLVLVWAAAVLVLAAVVVLGAIRTDPAAIPTPVTS